MADILKVTDLKVSFHLPEGAVAAVDGISFNIKPGETVGIVGESGSGKSVTALAIMNLLPTSGVSRGGSVIFDGRELVDISEKKMQKIRGKKIAMVFQEPMTSLNPVYTIGSQIIETLVCHRKLNYHQAREAAVEMLSMVGIPDPQNRMNHYPHQFSGGMRQRVMIAMALCCRPRLLIADEPTTALDVTIQAQIISLMHNLRERLSTSFILITHDLSMIAETCSRVLVMYAGNIVEQGQVKDIFYRPQHPYTQALLKAIPVVSANKSEKLTVIRGHSSHPSGRSTGCVFCMRCDEAMEVCAGARPPFFTAGNEHKSACWLLHPDAPGVKGRTGCG
ncbi:MAG TPA: ABC transporter ATP-binding protein [Clostridia bacterium]|nr:ABC transporter ATP-binding protein [Clostridia bacterium]